MIKGDRILSIGTPAGGGISIIASEPVTGGGGDTGFTPIATDLLFFLDAQTGIFTDAGSTPATNGQAIQQINEQSGAGITASNTNIGYQVATYEAPSINGLNSIRVQSNANLLERYPLSSDVNITNLFTIHWVYKKDTLSDNSLVIADGTAEINDSVNGYTYLLSATAYNSYDGGDDWTVASIVQRKGDNGFAYYYINGILMAEISNNAIATQSLDSLFQRTAGLRAGNYNVGDVLVYNQAQNLADVSFTQTGLNDKYGELFLPIDTSLSTPPTVGSTTLEWYHNPDFNTYSDVAKTNAVNLDFVRANKITTGDYASLYQHIAANQMQFKNTVLPNSKASYYKGGQDYMNMSDEKVFTSSESFVAYSVHKRTDINGTNAIFGKLANTNNVIMDWNSNLVYYRDASAGVSVSVTHSTNTVVRAYVIDRTAQLFRVYENGTQVNTASITTLTADTTFDIMFNRNTNGTGTIDHGITLLYRGLHSATDVGTVSDWLNAYYGDLIY